MARSFYKAFMAKKGDDQIMMKVDVSGDNFSPTIIDAVRDLYTNGMTANELLGFPLNLFFSTAATDEDGEPEEVAKPEGTEETYINCVTILKITPINQAQTDAAIIDGELEGKMSCLVALKNLTDGYHSAIMEYAFEHAESIQYKGTKEWWLQRFRAKRDMETDDPETWPEKLDWSLPKKYRKEGKDISVSVTQF